MQCNEFNDNEIAIIGLSCRFPESPDIESYWKLLQEGKEAITFFSDDVLRDAGISDSYLNDPHFINAGSVLKGIEEFDNEFFGYTPKEALIMDPQHRILLQCAWHAIEDAGYNPDTVKGKVGVFCSSAMNTYLLWNVAQNNKYIEENGFHEVLIGNDKDYLATKISYKLNLKGPSVNIQTSCSSSLVAVHHGCQSLLIGDCDMAICGGVSVAVPQTKGYRHIPGMIFSSDGHCRPFDHKSSGTVFGNGVGAVILKRLEDAIKSKDTIHAVIKASAINNDGSVKIGYTAPSMQGQVDVISSALSMAGITSDMISYIEAHGTATELGDSIEWAALEKVFEENNSGRNILSKCYVGSVKSNLGHMDAASGIAGLIKVVLSLKEKKIPPTLHFEKLNNKIKRRSDILEVNNELKSWDISGIPRIAGISSFGIGGTNSHVIVQEYLHDDSKDEKEDSVGIITLSAREPEILQDKINTLLGELDKKDQVFSNICYTLNIGRKNFCYRYFNTFSNKKDLKNKIASVNGPIETEKISALYPKIIFMFTGQGSEYTNMARGLYDSLPSVRDIIDDGESICSEILDLSLKRIFYEEKRTDFDSKHYDATYVQPFLFLIEYALASYLIKLGIKPDLLMGPGIGEYVALCISNTVSFKNALELVCARGKLMTLLSNFSMVTVFARREKIETFLNHELSIEEIENGEQIVVSGSREKIENLSKQLTDESIRSELLNVNEGFSCRYCDDLLKQFEKNVSRYKFNSPSIPIISSVNGEIINDQMNFPAYLTNQLRNTVLFNDGIIKITNSSSDKNRKNIFVEIGPGNVLCSYVKAISANNMTTVIDTIRSENLNHNDIEYLYKTIGTIWKNGGEIDWEVFYENDLRRRVSAPLYPFVKKKHWTHIESAQNGKKSEAVHEYDSGSLIEKDSLAEIKNKLHDIWCNEIGVEKIDFDANYMDIGGNSLIALRGLSKMNKMFGTNFQIVDIFENSTLNDLLQSITKNENVKRGAVSNESTMKSTTEEVKEWSVSFEEIRKEVHDIWCKEIGVELIDYDSDLMEIGGNSLIALKCLSKINERYKVNLQVMDLFENTSLSKLVKKVYKLKGQIFNSGKGSVAESKSNESIYHENDIIDDITMMKKQIHDIWVKDIGVEFIDYDSDLMENGGNSLVALRCLSKLNQYFKTELQIVDLFENPTINNLFNKVSGSLKFPTKSENVELSNNDERGNVSEKGVDDEISEEIVNNTFTIIANQNRILKEIFEKQNELLINLKLVKG